MCCGYRSIREKLEPRNERIIRPIQGPVVLRVFLRAINGNDGLRLDRSGLASAVRADRAQVRVFVLL